MIKLLTVITALIYVISVLALISSATAQKEINTSSTKNKHIVHHNNGNIDSAKNYSDNKR